MGTQFLTNTLVGLTNLIEQTMPLVNPGSCVGACASDVAEYILTWEKAPVASCDDAEPEPRTLRLLTNAEYQNTINDLFAVPSLSNITQGFPVNVRSGGYDNNRAANSVSEARLASYWDAAQTVAEAAVENRLSQVVGCDTHNQACAQSFVQAFGLRVFRRPLTEAEQSAYVSLFMEGASVAEGAERVISGLLISPHFLYRAELGESRAGDYILTPYETASLLAYTFTASTPDAALLQAAASDALKTREQLVAQVRRLLQAPTATTAMANFARQWLGVSGFNDVNKDSDTFPGFNDAVKAAMLTEVDLFIGSVFLGEDSTYRDLFVADYTYANDALASYYGLNGAGTNVQRIATNQQRGGILKLGAVLASYGKPNSTNPFTRGVFVRNHILCQHMPLPDATLDIQFPDLDPNLTTRERFSLHSDNPVCASCHAYIDDIGFGFDTFDGAGGLNPLPDDHGIITGLDDIQGTDSHPFQGVHELSEILANADGAAACVIEQFKTFASGTQPDACEIKRLAARWKAGGYSFQNLWDEIVSADNYLIRR